MGVMLIRICNPYAVEVDQTQRSQPLGPVGTVRQKYSRCLWTNLTVFQWYYLDQLIAVQEMLSLAWSIGPTMIPKPHDNHLSCEPSSVENGKWSFQICWGYTDLSREFYDRFALDWQELDMELAYRSCWHGKTKHAYHWSIKAENSAPWTPFLTRNP